MLRKSVDAGICTVLIGLEEIMEDNTLYNKIIDSIIDTEFRKRTEFENGKITSINYSFEQEGSAPLSMIFSNKKGRISEMISNEVGVKSDTAGAILNFSVMLILTYFVNEKQNSAIIQNDLNSQKQIILSKVPEGIRVLLGYSNFEYEDADDDSDTLVRTSFKSSFLNKIFKF